MGGTTGMSQPPKAASWRTSSRVNSRYGTATAVTSPRTVSHSPQNRVDRQGCGGADMTLADQQSRRADCHQGHRWGTEELDRHGIVSDGPAGFGLADPVQGHEDQQAEQDHRCQPATPPWSAPRNTDRQRRTGHCHDSGTHDRAEPVSDR